MALLDGELTPAQFETGRWRDADVVALIGRIEMRGSSQLDKSQPNGRGSILTVQAGEAAPHVKAVEIALGEPRRPMTRDDIEHKLRPFAEPLAGRRNTDAILATVDGLERCDDVRELGRLLRREARV